MSKVPWHMMAVRFRGRGPRRAASSSRVLILWANFSYMTLRLAQVLEPVPRGLGNGVHRPHGRRAPVVDMVEHDLDALLEAHRGLPAQRASDLRDVGMRAVGLPWPLRNMHRGPAQELYQAIDALGCARAHVEHLAGRARLRREEIGPRHVGDEDEVAGLRAVTHYREGMTIELLSKKNTEHRPVGA